MQSGLRQAFRSRPSSLLSRRLVVYPSLRSTQLFRTIVTKRYTAEHESIVFDDTTGIGVIAITDHAQLSLGDVVFVELPTVGTEVSQGDQIGAVESVKAASDIYAPVSGTVEEVNVALASEPGLLNRSPEDKGWLCRIRLSDPAQIEKLLTHEEYIASYE